MTQIRQRLASCFSAAFPRLRDAEVANAAVGATAGWDSLATVNLVALVEEEFHIQVSPEDIERFGSFEQIAEYLQRREATGAQ